jgi:hypothetical protein
VGKLKVSRVGEMKLGIVIPWRETPSRLEPFNYVLDWYKNNFSDAEIILTDTDGEVWEPSKARNLGVKKAQDLGCDVIVVGDADSIPQLHALNEAIEQCQEDNLIHNPFYLYKHLNYQSTQDYYSGLSIMSCFGHIYNDSVGGIWVCKPEVWWELGGMDEKFLQWGPEDRAFDVAHQIIKGTSFIKHEGWLISLAHERQENDAHFPKSHLYNTLLYAKYLQANTPEKMLELVRKKDLELIT